MIKIIIINFGRSICFGAVWEAIKKMSQKLEKVQRGGGGRGQRQKSISPQLKCGIFDKRGDPDFQVFPKCKCRHKIHQLNKRKGILK